MALGDFIDLYKILQVPPNADEATLKKRISEKYLEAKQNLDHRDAQKRLEFQQLFQVYLPEARHLLLDATHRAEYDRYLKAFLSGQPVEPPAPAAAPPAPQSYALSSADDFKAMDGEGVDPEKLAAQREQLWDKWKSGLETAPAPVAPVTPAASPAKSVAAPVSAMMNQPAAQPRPKRKIWAKPNDEAEVAKRRQEQAEREDARAHAQKVSAQADIARKSYSVGGGLIFLFTVLPFYLFGLKAALIRPMQRFFSDSTGKIDPNQIGTGNALLNYVFPVVIILGAFFFSQWAAEFGYQRTFKKNDLKAPTPGDRLGL